VNIRKLQQGLKYRGRVAAVPVVDAYAEGLFVDARSHSFPLRRSLLSLLESRARTNRWCVEQGRRVKTSRLSRLCTGDARIFERRFTKKAINTAITLLLDSSSSMNANDRMGLAKEACVALSLAIDAMQGVALEVMTFPYGSASLGRHGFGLAKDFNETTAAIKKRFSRISSNGGTPMAPAIVTAGSRLLRRPEPRKVMLVLTDGEPDSLELTHAAIETMKGIEMIGIGIESSEVARVFERFVVIQDVRDLPQQLLTKARELLAA
jgi:nitric oxide reductase activation protein